MYASQKQQIKSPKRRIRKGLEGLALGKILKNQNPQAKQMQGG